MIITVKVGICNIMPAEEWKYIEQAITFIYN
jgi:hypothetical protein